MLQARRQQERPGTAVGILCKKIRYLEFQKKVYLKSGIGEETYLPPFIFHDPPIQPSMKQARLEAAEVMFGAMDELLEKTGLNPQDIDILIASCSCFTPTPSLASMVVNHYKMRSNVCSLNLGGMGCSGGMVAVDLAKHLLRSFASSNPVIINTENITLNWYRGNNRSMLISICLFRVGAAAILLSNKRSERNRAKYQLYCSVRTHTAADDKAFQSAFQEEDEDGLVGISLSKHIMIAAADAIKENMTQLGSLVLPYSEQLRFLISCFSPKIFQTAGKAYVPNFKLAFQHFLIHTGGRAVLDGIQNKLSLSNDHMEASRMTLHRFGNTSSSSIWYALAYLEAKERVKKTDRIWLVGLGAGFKCNSVVLKALRTVKQPSMNPWLDCLHKYPMKISTDMTDIFRSDKLLYRTNSGKLFDCMKGQRIETDHV
ncbi:hypothetical protein O6H91_02G108500 [Diphasiastrum complanatum]|uniref:Uncharacterized protein n=1 Tax=Diphasiastrum complanatum TaxID=34168 RepID=A0ACC2EJH7_DIPCM|nr:hypothetical protein O6H91_02G108500 [Diphasiastrum complanatum]